MSFDRAAEVFEELLALDPEQRAPELEGRTDLTQEVRELVREMLSGEASPALGLDQPISLGNLPGALEVPADGRRNESQDLEGIASFEILDILGQGGMGIVYRARQANPEREVALKVLRPTFATTDLSRRFRREAQVLGWLDHPGIARVFEAGTAETALGEQAYIAMERIEGLRLDEWVKREQPTIEARLHLLAGLAEAVHHAHQKGVVHRDLKPANILVTADHRPKVLDFGIARLIQDDGEDHTGRTRTGALLGTLPYMSPEQVQGGVESIDVRTDIYALGVIAYELLSGTRPLDVQGRSLPEAARIIVEDEPTQLGDIDRRLRGDIEVVIAKALAKEVDRRYSDARELAVELGRILDHEPVQARSPSRIYFARKFARRHRGFCVGLTLTFLMLSTATLAATLQYFEQSELLERKGDEAEVTREAIQFFEELIEGANPYAENELTVRDVARLAGVRVRGKFEGRPGLRSRLQLMLGKTHRNLRLFEESESLLVEALELCRVANGEDSLEYGVLLAQVGVVTRLRSGGAASLPQLERAVDHLRNFEGAHVKLAVALSCLGNAYMDLADFEEAAAAQQEALELLEGRVVALHPELLSIRGNVVHRLLLEGNREEAERRAVELLGTLPEKAPARVSLLRTLANLQRLLGRYGEAEANARRAVELHVEHYGESSATHATNRLMLASVLLSAGRKSEAVQEARLAYEALPHSDHSLPRARLNVLQNVAYVLGWAGEDDEAEMLLLEALDGYEELGDQGPNMLEARHNLAQLYSRLGRLDDAVLEARAALEGRRACYKPGHPDLIPSIQGLAAILERRGELEEARELRAEVEATQ